MDLIGSLTGKNNVRGITLNSQQIDLFNLIEQAQSREEAVEKIYEYLDQLLQVRIMAKKMNSQGLTLKQKIAKVIYEKLFSLTPQEKDELFNILSTTNNLMQIRGNLDSEDKLRSLIENKNINQKYVDMVWEIYKYFAYQTQGILTFLVDKDGKTIDLKAEEIEVDKNKTYQKVEALYKYVVGSIENGEKRFNRLTLDGQGKFGTVAGVIKTENEAQAKPEDYNLASLIQGYEFAKAHNMDIRINALVFFKDFQGRLVGENADAYRNALINYGKAIASVANEYATKGVHTTIDMFNEFVDYYEPFSERTNNWMSKLSVEDLCEIARELKKEMPNVDFGYNDWNFENPKKRAAIFKVIRKIQAFEKEHDCKIINHIGTQCHTSINDVEGLRVSIEELQQFGLPIDITELDISKGLEGVDYKKAKPEELEAIRKYEQKLQNDIMKIMSEFVKSGKIRGITSWSITDELCCDFCNGEQASITGMSYDSKAGFTFFGKDMDNQIEMSLKEMKLIQEHISRIGESKKQEVNQNPIQDFCLHTHTQRCGHAKKDTSDEEYVIEAINGGLKRLVFTDHIPMPDGMNHRANKRMDIAEVPSYLASIEYLQDKYRGQIQIQSGFEFEYSDRDMKHLQKLKSKTDKMILGQHFVIDDKGNEYGIVRGMHREQISDKVLQLYANSIISAIKKGLPDVIAHPDLFMQARDNFGTLEIEITRAICRSAAENGIPLEINLGKISFKLASKMPIVEMKKKIPYPSQKFWEIVAEETKRAKEKKQDLIVIYGKDAHDPKCLSKEQDYEIAKAIIGEQTLAQLHIVTSYEELDRIFLSKKEMQEAQTGRKEIRDILTGAIETTEALTRTGQMNEQLRNLEKSGAETLCNKGERNIK